MHQEHIGNEQTFNGNTQNIMADVDTSDGPQKLKQVQLWCDIIDKQNGTIEKNIPDALAPPNGCCPTTEPVDLSLI